MRRGTAAPRSYTTGSIWGSSGSGQARATTTCSWGGCTESRGIAGPLTEPAEADTACFWAVAGGRPFGRASATWARSGANARPSCSRGRPACGCPRSGTNPSASRSSRRWRAVRRCSALGAARSRRSSPPMSARWATRSMSWWRSVPALAHIDPAACRARVERHFTHHVMTAEYVRMFRAYLTTGVLPEGRLGERALAANGR